MAIVVAVGCGSDARPAGADDAHRRYHDGERWIEVTVLLDRLDEERAPASQPGAHATTGVLTLQPAKTSLADLEATAGALRTDAGRVAVYACLVPRGADPAVAQPLRLTRRLTLTGAPGQDLAVLAARHGARVVEKVSFRADTVVCEATGPSLLAALDAANALREEPGVVAATPLIARQHQPRSR